MLRGIGNLKTVLYNNFINKKLPVVMEELPKYRELYVTALVH